MTMLSRRPCRSTCHATSKGGGRAFCTDLRYRISQLLRAAAATREHAAAMRTASYFFGEPTEVDPLPFSLGGASFPKGRRPSQTLAGMDPGGLAVRPSA